MNMYNLISKKSLYTNQKEPVNLIEYMIFNDQEKDETFMVLKFKNQTSDVINRIEIEIIEQDNQFETIKKATYVFEDLDINPLKEIVPLKKIKVDGSCKLIKHQFLSVTSGERIWTDGTWSDEVIEVDEPVKIVEVKEDVEESLTYQMKVINHQAFSFPYFVSILFVIAFVFVVIMVFNAIN